MKSRKFPTYDEAKAYLESVGKLQFFGRVGNNAEIYVYTLTIGAKEYHLNVYADGKVELTLERYV